MSHPKSYLTPLTPAAKSAEVERGVGRSRFVRASWTRYLSLGLLCNECYHCRAGVQTPYQTVMLLIYLRVTFLGVDRTRPLGEANNMQW